MSAPPPPWLTPATRRALDLSAPCVQCGACDRAAPAGLAPQRLHALVLDGRLPDADAGGLGRWNGCDACDAACPSRIPLSALLRDARAEQARRQAARERFLARNARLERDAAAAAGRRQAALQQAGGEAVAAAIARARARARRERGR